MKMTLLVLILFLLGCAVKPVSNGTLRHDIIKNDSRCDWPHDEGHGIFVYLDN